MFAVISFATAVATAKIPPMKPVAPVESNGVRYSAVQDGAGPYVVADDITTGKQLWRVRVFRTRIKPWIEADVQWILIKELKLVESSLFVRDGKARCYAVNTRDHRVRKAVCSSVFAEQERSR
jgi:outer membrane protein assembly factor BamB